MTSGRRDGLAFALGILAGSAAWGVAAAAGLSALMLANAWMFELIRYAGALYLGWLAVKAARAAWHGGTATGRPFSGTFGTLFAKGAAIHITNPKAILSWGAIYAIALPAGAAPGMVWTVFALLYTGSILVFIGYALLFSTPRMVRVYAGARRWFDLGFAGFFGFASWKVLTARL